MWNKSREGQPSPSAPAQPPAPAPQYQPAVASSGASRPTVFGKSMKIVGEVSSDEELQLDGDLEGKLTLNNRLTVGPSSNVKANIKASEVVVFGTVHGNVEAENRITLRTGANLVGDIKTAGIVIEDGAYFKGGIDISRPEAGKASPKSAGAAAGQKR
ncbi:MAG TPA: polymer-forming cytoskeletal protein [Bryobacteraceae bacterium]|nr:polymer-forming cytoskeletal protein [Bryobacteraceae bacterium]